MKQFKWDNLLFINDVIMSMWFLMVIVVVLCVSVFYMFLAPDKQTTIPEVEEGDMLAIELTPEQVQAKEKFKKYVADFNIDKYLTKPEDGYVDVLRKGIPICTYKYNTVQVVDNNVGICCNDTNLILSNAYMNYKERGAVGELSQFADYRTAIIKWYKKTCV